MDFLLMTIILGVTQGLTEFLPVSSSGHLVIFQELMNFNTPGIIMEVILHAGTLAAVLFYFRKDLLKLELKYLWLLLVGTVPAGILGLFFNDYIERLFQSLSLVAGALILTGIMNYFSDKQDTVDKDFEIKDALFIGLFQAFAIMPGISRSGATIFAALLLGKERSEAAKFSFLLSIPAIIGANLLELTKFDNLSAINFYALAGGFSAAFITGVVAIKIMINFVKNRSLKYFAVYTIVLGLILLIVK